MCDSRGIKGGGLDYMFRLIGEVAILLGANRMFAGGQRVFYLSLVAYFSIIDDKLCAFDIRGRLELSSR